MTYPPTPNMHLDHLRSCSQSPSHNHNEMKCYIVILILVFLQGKPRSQSFAEKSGLQVCRAFFLKNFPAVFEEVMNILTLG